MSNKYNFVYQMALSTLAMVFAVSPVYALPGENTNTVLKWVKTKPQLPTLEYGAETFTYFGKKGNLWFYVSEHSTNKTVVSEAIEIHNEPSIKFTKKNTQAIKLAQDIYNANIANDFKNSQYVTKISGNHYYRGQRFGYVTTDSEGSSELQIIPVKSLQEAINTAKYCQTHECGF
jgi:hypothetical protein